MYSLSAPARFNARLIFPMIENAFPSWPINLTVGFDNGAFILCMPPFVLRTAVRKIKGGTFKMKAPLSKPTVKLIGQDGNSFAIMGNIKRALKRAGADKEYIDEYLKEATSGDYNHLLTVSMKYVHVK